MEMKSNYTLKDIVLINDTTTNRSFLGVIKRIAFDEDGVEYVVNVYGLNETKEIYAYDKDECKFIEGDSPTYVIKGCYGVMDKIYFNE